MLSKGHIGAGGSVSLLIEAARQLMGKAGPRQVPDARFAVETATGGTYMDAQVTILGTDPGRVMAMATGHPPKPGPIVSAWARPFWDAAREHQLMLQRCDDCREVRSSIRASPARTAARDELAGSRPPAAAPIYSYTVVENNAPIGFRRRTYLTWSP